MQGRGFCDESGEEINIGKRPPTKVAGQGPQRAAKQGDELRPLRFAWPQVGRKETGLPAQRPRPEGAERETSSYNPLTA